MPRDGIETEEERTVAHGNANRDKSSCCWKTAALFHKRFIGINILNLENKN